MLKLTARVQRVLQLSDKASFIAVYCVVMNEDSPCPHARAWGWFSGVYSISCESGSMSFRVETRLTRRARLGSPRTEGRGVASVAGAVKGGRSPAKRTVDGVRNGNTLKGLGLVGGVYGQLPSPSGGEDFPALGSGARGGGARRALREELWRRGGSTRNGVNPEFRCGSSWKGGLPAPLPLAPSRVGCRPETAAGSSKPLSVLLLLALSSSFTFLSDGCILQALVARRKEGWAGHP